MALIAQMVGRNEANRHLKEVLSHLTKIVDHVVFTDDCSTDNTKEMAQEFGCFTYQTSENLFSVDEGRLRSFAWSNLENHASSGDWILAIDCDEKLFGTGPSLDTLMDQDQYDVLAIEFYHMWDETHYRVDKLWKPNISSRMFRYENNGVFRDSKLACGSEPTYVQRMIGQGRFNRKTGLKMQHLGYIRDEDKQAKYKRYMTIDGGKFHQNNHILSIIDPEPILVEWPHG